MSEYKPTILTVEDDADLAQFNAKLLGRQGYDVLIAHSCAAARAILAGCTPDLLVLDIELPDGDGFSLCEEFRRKTDTPVLFLTGKSDSIDKVTGLSSGGDYYLTKPFDREEFLAVVSRLLHRAEQTKRRLSETVVITRGPLTLNTQERTACVDGRDAKLTQKEFAVLLMLVQHEGSVLTGEAIYQSIWGADMSTDTGIIRVNISRIKKKLQEEDTDSFCIYHEHGKGYAFTME